MQEYKIVAVNYADDAYKKAQRLNTKTAYKKGKVDFVYSYTREDLPNDFVDKNKDILNEKKGGGYYLWKPYLILRTYESLDEGDYLIYSDSGGFYYTGDIHKVVELMKKHDKWLLVQEEGYLEKHYTKRDTFIALDCDTPFYANGLQCISGLLIIKKCEIGYNFLGEWLEYAQNRAVISDDDNIYGHPNYEGFIAHRHDQSIFSLLRRKYGIDGFDDIRETGDLKIVCYHHTCCGYVWQAKIVHWYKKNIYYPLIIKVKHQIKNILDFSLKSL